MADEVLWFVRLMESTSAILGGFITYIAYRSYRQNRLHSILLAAIGFALLTIGTVLEGFLFEVLHQPILEAQVVRASVSTIGFFILLISIRQTSQR